jgi:hypothetical protein
MLRILTRLTAAKDADENKRIKNKAGKVFFIVKKFLEFLRLKLSRQ